MLRINYGTAAKVGFAIGSGLIAYGRLRKGEMPDELLNEKVAGIALLTIFKIGTSGMIGFEMESRLPEIVREVLERGTGSDGNGMPLPTDSEGNVIS